MNQLEIPLHDVRMAEQDMVIRQPSFAKAIVVSADLAGMEDKQAADAAGVDPGTWSKIKTGQANFPMPRFRQYQQRCGYWLPLQFIANECGFGLVRLESEVERELRQVRAERDEERRTRLYAESLLTGRAR